MKLLQKEQIKEKVKKPINIAFETIQKYQNAATQEIKKFNKIRSDLEEKKEREIQEFEEFKHKIEQKKKALLKEVKQLEEKTKEIVCEE